MSVRARVQRIERAARGHLPHAGDVLARAWAKVPDADLEVLAGIADGPDAHSADEAARRLWPALVAHYERLNRTVADLEHLPPTDARWLARLPHPSDEAVREALEVLDASAPPEGERDAWLVARLLARLTLGVRDAYA